MSEIKFRCPECTQKIAVEASAAGVKIDCPTCHSRLVVPRSSIAPVEVLRKRGDSATDAAHLELQAAKDQAAKAVEELRQARSEAEAQLSARAELEKEVESLRPLREQLSKARSDLAATAGLEGRLAEAENAAAALRAELTTLHATHGETEDRLATMTAELGALQHEREKLANAASEAGELRNQIADTRKELERARSDAISADEAHRAQVDAVRGIETGIRAELAAVRTQNVQAEARLMDLEAERTQLTGIVEELLPLREELEKSRRELSRIAESAAEKARGYESEIEAAKASGAELHAKHAQAQAQIHEQASRLELAAKRAAELESEAEAAKSMRGEFTAAQDELQRVRTEMEEKAQELEKTLRQQADEMQAKLRDAERRHAAVANGFTALKQERADLAVELDSIRKARDEAAALAAERLKTLEKLTPAMEAAKGELARLREEVNTAAVEKGRLAATLEKAAAERKDLVERGKNLELAEAESRKEIARLTQLVEAANTAAKNRDTQFHLLTARTESMGGIVQERESAARNALADLERMRRDNATALERAEKAERELAGAAERTKKSEAEKAGLAEQLSRKAAELESLKGGAARAKDTQTAGAPPTEREKALESERDALIAALDRAKQHVGVLQARRDMLRDEVATLRSRLGIGGLTTPADEKPIAK